MFELDQTALLFCSVAWVLGFTLGCLLRFVIRLFNKF